MEIDNHLVYLSLGSNLGDRKSNIDKAIIAINKYCGTIEAISNLYESPAWGYQSTNTYYNNCIAIKTNLTPLQLLKQLKEIEQSLGRNSTLTYSDRPIDIDIIFYDDLVLELENLKIPHPHIAKRAFVLKPMQELNAEFMHPQHFLTIKQLLVNLSEHTQTKAIEPKL